VGTRVQQSLWVLGAGLFRLELRSSLNSFFFSSFSGRGCTGPGPFTEQVLGFRVYRFRLSIPSL
jgi:hypothetical protein